MRILALDLAKNRSGLALYEDGIISTWNVGKNTPISLLDHIKETLQPGDVVIVEEHVHFRGAKTTRVLIELNGFVYWSLVCLGYDVIKLFPYKARKRMSDHYTNIPDDEKDAVMLIHEHLDSFEPLQVERKSTNVEKNLFRKSSKKRAKRGQVILDDPFQLHDHS